METRGYTIYRLYNAEHNLLYVSITKVPAQRFGAHRVQSLLVVKGCENRNRYRGGPGNRRAARSGANRVPEAPLQRGAQPAVCGAAPAHGGVIGATERTSYKGA